MITAFNARFVSIQSPGLSHPITLNRPLANSTINYAKIHALTDSDIRF